MANIAIKNIILTICIIYQYTATYWLLRKSLNGALPEKKGMFAIIGLYGSFMVCQFMSVDIIRLFIAYLIFLTAFWITHYSRVAARYGVQIWRNILIMLILQLMFLNYIFIF